MCFPRVSVSCELLDEICTQLNPDEGDSILENYSGTESYPTAASELTGDELRFQHPNPPAHTTPRLKVPQNVKKKTWNNWEEVYLFTIHPHKETTTNSYSNISFKNLKQIRYSEIVKQSYHQADASLEPQTQARSEQSDSQFSSR